MINSAARSVYVAGLLLCLALVTQGAAANSPAPRAAAAATTKSATSAKAASKQVLPDWSGGWRSMRQALLDSNAALQPVLRSTAQAGVRQHGELSRTNQLDIRSVYCQPPTFGGYSGGFHGSIEFLFTRDRVTVIWEGGLVRRLYTDGRALPEKPEPTDAGTSVAHWEGQTLVVKTVGLRPEANALDIAGIPVGQNAVVTERMFLKDADTLQVDATLEAPDALTAPAKVTYQYLRRRNYTMTDFTACPAFDRSVDPGTGYQRFDMTPPTDLPPPPKD